MRGKPQRSAEEVAALAVLRAAEAAREKAARQAKRVRRAYTDLLKALQVTLSELPGDAQDRGLRIVTAITSDWDKLSVCEKALAKAPRAWEKVETSVEGDSPARAAAE